MRNLDWLYDTDEPFRNAVCGAAADWLGSTSANFADAWLRERHHEDDEACLLGQHAEPDESDSREKLEANIREGSMMTIENDVQFVHAPFKSVQRWLDRQAEITRREWEGPIMKAGRDAVEVERSIAEKYRADAIAAQAERDELKRDLEIAQDVNERQDMEYIAFKRELNEAKRERDAYRELCGKFRAMANEMLVMEVDEC